MSTIKTARYRAYTDAALIDLITRYSALWTMTSTGDWTILSVAFPGGAPCVSASGSDRRVVLEAMAAQLEDATWEAA